MADCCPDSSDLTRRDFLKAGAAAAGVVGMAGKVLVSAQDDDASAHLVPADKKLTPEWLKAQSERGEAEWYEGDELKYVGMPIGGIGCGQLYLSGDGRLWHWDIFQPWYSSPYISHPQGLISNGLHYTDPPTPDDDIQRPLESGCAIQVRQGDEASARTLAAESFGRVRFRGEYPVGRVEYRDDGLPIEVDLEAFSPFLPLNADDSGLPCTVLNYTLRNTSDASAEVSLGAWLQNVVCPEQTDAYVGSRRIDFGEGRMTFSAREPDAEPESEPRPAVTLADFEGPDYGDWTVEGDAFGTAPFKRDELADFDQIQGVVGDGVLNTHQTRIGDGSPGTADNCTGTLTSPEFEITRRYINFLIAGGHQPDDARIELLIGGEVVAWETGQSDITLRRAGFDVREHEGKTAVVRVIDRATGGWGHIVIDEIVMADTPPIPTEPVDQLPGFGTMAMRVLGADSVGAASFDLRGSIDQLWGGGADAVETSFDEKPAAAVSGTVSLAPGEERTVTVLLTWHFPHYRRVGGEMAAVTDLANLKRRYAKRFADADEVADYVEAEMDRLAGVTKLWNETWYDSTLPYWLLDRSFISIDCLATTTVHWFDTGRVWAWEGVDCCPGTCQHVWNYAQGMARIFPELERSLRSVTDYGISYNDSGALDYRGESSRMVAHDGQAGTIMRTWREHTISGDDSFLEPIWPKVKKSVQFLMELDVGRDGILDCSQYNTLDAAWEGPMAWMSSCYLGALSAGAAMADDMGDPGFATECRAIIEKGRTNIVDQLFDGEYFIHIPNDDFVATNTNDGCHIDQVLGQSWASQLGLERVVPKVESESALRSIYKYNFALDAGGYRNTMQDVISGGRWYAMPGEAGLLMTTWPKGGAEKAPGQGTNAHFVGYFNECMNGFEYQVAAHMVYEAAPGSDLVDKALAITRAVHDRYAALKRNPYNEIECSDHYSRSMAAYGLFLALCGFEYHGPSGYIGFAPRLTPESFRAPFTSAEGWGTFEQSREPRRQTERIMLKWGSLALRELSFQLAEGHVASGVTVTVDGRDVEARLKLEGAGAVVTLSDALLLADGEELVVVLE